MYKLKHLMHQVLLVYPSVAKALQTCVRVSERAGERATRGRRQLRIALGDGSTRVPPIDVHGLGWVWVCRLRHSHKDGAAGLVLLSATPSSAGSTLKPSGRSVLSTTSRLSLPVHLDGSKSTEIHSASISASWHASRRSSKTCPHVPCAVQIRRRVLERGARVRRRHSKGSSNVNTPSRCWRRLWRRL